MPAKVYLVLSIISIILYMISMSNVHETVINADPEGASWFFKLKIKDKSELDSLMSKDEYDKFCKENPS